MRDIQCFQSKEYRIDHKPQDVFIFKFLWETIKCMLAIAQECNYDYYIQELLLLKL